MSPEVARKLATLNRTFYERYAGSFSATRSPSRREITWILDWIPPHARILDLACGNGRACTLCARLHPRCYVGVDASQGLLAEARAHEPWATWVSADLLAESPREVLHQLHLPTRYDVVLLLAFLHHVPGHTWRASVLGEAADLVDIPGRLLVSTWQFLTHPRMREKILPWDVAGLDPSQVDPGDALVRWGDAGVRYCHHVSRDELLALCEACGLEVERMWETGDSHGALSLNAVVRRGFPLPPRGKRRLLREGSDTGAPHPAASAQPPPESPPGQGQE